MGLLAFFTGGGLDNNGSSGEKEPEDEKYARAQEDDTSLGNILVEMGHITPETLERAIKIQKSQSLLGGILVSMEPDEGGISKAQLEEALLEQKIRRRKAKPLEVIRSNSKRHSRLVDEVQEKLISLEGKYSSASEE